MITGKDKTGFSRRTVLAGTAAAFTLPNVYVNRARAAGWLVVRDPAGPWTKAGQEGSTRVHEGDRHRDRAGRGRPRADRLHQGDGGREILYLGRRSS